MIVIDTQSETFGIKLVDDNAQQLIQQFNGYVVDKFNKLGSSFEEANQLWAGELLRYGFDFYEFLEQQQQEVFVNTCLREYVISQNAKLQKCVFLMSVIGNGF